MRLTCSLRWIAFALAILTTSALPSAANAATMHIAALGASNTAGKRISPMA